MDIQNMTISEIQAEYGIEIVLPKVEKESIVNEKTAFNAVNSAFKNLDCSVENLVVANLNSQNEVINFQTVSKGTINQTTVHPREVFKNAILSGARSIIMAHNHPSGHLMPSLQDIAITNQIKEAGEILGIELLDHIIVYGDSYKSMKQEGHF